MRLTVLVQAVSKCSERAADGGRRSAGTAVYEEIHEDSEHRRTPSGARAVILIPLVVSFGLWLLFAPVAWAAVVVLDAQERSAHQAAFQEVDLIEARNSRGQADSPLEPFPLAGLAVDRGQVVLDHQRPLSLKFREPVAGIAFSISDPRKQATLALTLFRGEHEVGRQVFAHQLIPGSRVALIEERENGPVHDCADPTPARVQGSEDATDRRSRQQRWCSSE